MAGSRPRRRWSRSSRRSAMSDWSQETALSGSMVLALPVALAAGLISFFSPCVIPLLPGYLSYATGISGGDLDQARRGRMVLGATLFVLGFSVVFVLLGSLTGAAGAWLFTHTRQLNVVLGVITILLGVAFLGAFGFLQRDWRIHKVPAVGPTLAAINVLSVNEATAGRGALLSAVFALGLGLPFIAPPFAARRKRG